MPRWLWLLLLGSMAALWLAGRGGQAPLTGQPACPPPPRFTDAAEPMQSALPGNFKPFRHGKATITPLAGFSLQARVLSRENYSWGPESNYSPTDLALGWGPMAAPGLAEQLHVSQGGRWYRYSWSGQGPPLPLAQIIGNSANMHMVPADRAVADRLADIDAGDVVRVHGWLVRIEGDGGWRWTSSMSRQDSGSGSCELVLVCSIER